MIFVKNSVFVKDENTPLSLKATKALFTGENMFNGNFALFFNMGLLHLEVTWHIMEVPFILDKILQNVLYSVSGKNQDLTYFLITELS